MCTKFCRASGGTFEGTSDCGGGTDGVKGSGVEVVVGIIGVEMVGVSVKSASVIETNVARGMVPCAGCWISWAVWSACCDMCMAAAACTRSFIFAFSAICCSKETSCVMNPGFGLIQLLCNTK